MVFESLNEKIKLTSNGKVLYNSENKDACDKGPKEALKRNLTLKQCFLTVIGNLIGSGLFMSPALVAKRTPNSFVALCVWACAGFISLLGSLCYCELVSVIRKTGSTYIFVFETYGKMLAFPLLMSILFFLAPFGFNTILLTASTYACVPFIEDQSSSEFYWITRIVALGILWLITFVSCLGTRNSSRFQMAIFGIQLFSIVALGVAGIWYVAKTGDTSNFKPEIMFNNTINGVVDDIPAFGASIFSALFCFDGWYIIASFAEEIENPKRNLPLIAGTGLPFVTILYAIVNLSCLAILSHQEMGASEVVFTSAFQKLGLPNAQYIVPVFVLVSSSSTCLSGFYNQSRFIMSASREGQLPKFLSLIHQKNSTPIPAMMLICLLTSIFLFFGFNIEDMLQLYNVSMWIEYGVAFSTVLYLRYKLPNARRIYRVWITTAVFMVLVSVLLSFLLVIRLPLGGVAMIILIAVSIPLYYFFIVKNYGKVFKLDEFSSWLVNNSSLVVNEFDETDWDKLEDIKRDSKDYNSLK